MPTNPYTSQAISGYNASPPPDDGTQTSANQLEWGKHIEKIGDPVKVLSEAINTAMLTAGARLINTDSEEDNAIAGSLAFTGVNATVTDGVISPKVSRLFLDTESAATSDTLSHIATTTATNNPRDGAVLFLGPVATAREIVISDRATSTATGSIHLLQATDMVLDQFEDTLLLEKRGEDWYQIGGRLTEPVVTRRGYIDGLQVSNTATDTANDITIGLGQAALSDGSSIRLFSVDTAITKQLDATWATGSTAGGMPSTVTYAATTPYHVFLLGDPVAGVEAGLDTSVSATGLLATATGFTFFRRIWSVLTSTATTVEPFTQLGDDCLFTGSTTAIRDVNTTMSATAVLFPLSVPTDIKVDANILAGAQATQVAGIMITSPDQSDLSVGFATDWMSQLTVNDVNFISTNQLRVRTDTSGQIRIRTSVAPVSSVQIRTLGWRDDRGRNATA